MPHTIIFPVMLPLCWAQYTAGCGCPHCSLMSWHVGLFVIPSSSQPFLLNFCILWLLLDLPAAFSSDSLSCCISSSSPQAIHTQMVFPHFSSMSSTDAKNKIWKSVTGSCNLPAHPFLVFVLHIQSPTQMQPVHHSLWMPFLLHCFRMTQLQRYAIKQLVGFFFLLCH